MTTKSAESMTLPKPQQDLIAESYARALEWAEDLWSVSRLTPYAVSHCPDRLKANQALLDRFDSLWVEAKQGKTTPETASKAMLEWWIDLGILMADIEPLGRINEKAPKMRFKGGVTMGTPQGNPEQTQQLEMVV